MMLPPHSGCTVTCVYMSTISTFVDSPDGWGRRMFKHGFRPPFPNLVGEYGDHATGSARKVTNFSASAHIKSRVGAITWKLES